jgi:putative transposase
MNEIIATLATLRPILSATTFRQLTIMIEATLAMTGRVTMEGISRWTEKGGSYRTVQRFFEEPQPWSQWLGLLIKKYFGTKSETVCILAADEVVVTKSGKHTHGLGKFYSSIQNQPVSALCFLNVSLIDTQSRESYPLLTEQLIRESAQESAPKAVKNKTSSGKVGRPKGSKNKNRAEVELSSFQLQLQGCIRRALGLTGDDIPLKYLAYDGALGNNAGLQMVRQTGLHLISKMRHDSSLYFPYEGEYSGKGKPRKYGDKLTLERLKPEHFCAESVKKDIKTTTYQVQVWHKNFPDLLNVVVIVKTSLKTGRTAKVLLFSDDLGLAYDKLVDYYQLRFQIEFNFRDAKQYWGLEDFMNVKETQVSNAANFALFMVTFSQLLLPKIKGLETGSMLDLKTVFRARKYTRRIINSLGIKSEEFLIDDRIFQAAEIGRIHAKAA